jgi:hypothetical protein
MITCSGCDLVLARKTCLVRGAAVATGNRSLLGARRSRPQADGSELEFAGERSTAVAESTALRPCRRRRAMYASMMARTSVSSRCSSPRNAASTRCVGKAGRSATKPSSVPMSSLATSSARASLVAVSRDGVLSPTSKREIVEWFTPDRFANCLWLMRRSRSRRRSQRLKTTAPAQPCPALPNSTATLTAVGIPGAAKAMTDAETASAESSRPRRPCRSLSTPTLDNRSATSPMGGRDLLAGLDLSRDEDRCSGPMEGGDGDPWPRATG